MTFETFFFLSVLVASIFNIRNAYYWSQFRVEKYFVITGNVMIIIGSIGALLK